MDIIFVESTLRQRDNVGGSIAGVVFFRFGTTCFPGDGWNDLVVVIAGWWLQAIERLTRDSATECELRFIDGPAWITISMVGAGRVLIKCVEDRFYKEPPRIVYEQEMLLNELIAEVIRFACRVVAVCSSRGFESKDLRFLHARLPN